MKSNKEYPKLIVGAGSTGESVAEYFQKSNIPFIIIDEFLSTERLLQLKNKFGDCVRSPVSFDQSFSEPFSQVILSPGVSPQREIVKNRINQIPITNDIALFLANAKKPCIGITGSNGKSTTCLLLQEVLRQGGYSSLIGGNFGTPALTLLDQPLPDFYILELSSFQLEIAHSYTIAIGAILNVTDDHLDRHGSYHEYLLCKMQLALHAKRVIVSGDDEILMNETKKRNPHIYPFYEKNHPKTFYIDIGFDKQPFHNKKNLLAVCEIINGLGIKLDFSKVMLNNFEGLPHRFENIITINGVTFINDSKGTNPGCVIEAVRYVNQPIILLLGGQTKNTDLRPLAKVCSEKVMFTVCFGQDASRIQQVMQEYNVYCYSKPTVSEATRCAYARAINGDSILFSPAGASFDQYSGGYSMRGNDFCSTVYNLI
ncbi:MAG: UDP-N-acetylmuramoyl-L-alanine--D-glutamate ligase [Methylacidiphilales bacterium]|nr:UDP-N-acetylmuramoyl-L-alanine--D-glutamate ligase [Candidatus Methylacidiphilales bacterium]